jgi:hypothetical protein
MKDTFVEQLIRWKMIAEMQELEFTRLANYLQTKHPRVWAEYGKNTLMGIIKETPPKEE